MILSCQSIYKAFGIEEILKDVSFHIEEGEKAALVGPNGSGKSTLLKIIAGKEEADSGEVVIPKIASMGYLAQHQDLEGETIFEAVLEIKRPILEMERSMRHLETEMKSLSGQELTETMEQYHKVSSQYEAANGYAWKSEVTGVLKGLGFDEDEFSKKVDTLSGGEKTRVSLSRLLLMNPDLLLLDEPTNHLDIASISWLENFLLHYQGAVLIVSHDRYFMDHIVSKVFDLENGRLESFGGNYSDYAKKKAALREARLKAWYNQQQEIHHQQEVIAKLKSFNREKSIKRAESREKMLDRIEVLDKPMELNDAMRLQLEPEKESGNDVLTVENLSKSFPGQVLFSGLNFDVKRGERVAIIGANGTGKTTILKILNNLADPDTGLIRLGSNVQIGYYDQEHHVLHMDKTVFEEISDAFPNLTETRIRNVLAAFLFTGDDVFQQIKTLSGGERGRVSLAKLMLTGANFLILDEPTNHLDITSKEILEHALVNYSGTVLYVSHDRYFINQTATRILELVHNTFVNYIGNYDYYLEKKDELTAKVVKDDPAMAQSVTSESDAKVSWKQNKEQQAQERKRKNELKRVEDRISELEEKSDEIDDLLSQPEVATDVARCIELTNSKTEIDTELSDLYERWEALAE